MTLLPIREGLSLPLDVLISWYVLLVVHNVFAVVSDYLNDTNILIHRIASLALAVLSVLYFVSSSQSTYK